MGGAGWGAWGALVLLAAVWVRPGRLRRVRAGAGRGPRPGRGPSLRVRFAALLPGRHHVRPESEVGTVLVAVAARLRAGMAPAAAWEHSLRRASAPVARDLRVALAGGRLPAPRRAGRARGPRAAASSAAYSAAAARDVADRLGAELAGVLDQCAAGIEEAGRAAADRASSLGAPRATARLLGWLPLGGLVLGTGLGADPLGWLFGSWWGLVVTLIAVALTVAGHMWIGALVAAAERAGA